MAVLYLNMIEDLKRIAFVDGIAEVDVPVRLLYALPLIGEDRPETERLHRLMRIIRNRGYGGAPRIVVQVDAKGYWSVIDGGHRITAARRIAREFWTNLIAPKVVNLHFLLHQCSRSDRSAKQTSLASAKECKAAADGNRDNCGIDSLPPCL